jgi:hypothetical protein
MDKQAWTIKCVDISLLSDGVVGPIQITVDGIIFTVIALSPEYEKVDSLSYHVARYFPDDLVCHVIDEVELDFAIPKGWCHAPLMHLAKYKIGINAKVG